MEIIYTKQGNVKWIKEIGIRKSVFELTPLNWFTMRCLRLLLLLTPILFLQTSCSQERDQPFYDEIQAFKMADKTLLQNAILFTGSSSIRLWTTLEQDFPGYTVIWERIPGARAK